MPERENKPSKMEIALACSPIPIVGEVAMYRCIKKGNPLEDPTAISAGVIGLRVCVYTGYAAVCIATFKLYPIFD